MLVNKYLDMYTWLLYVYTYEYRLICISISIDMILSIEYIGYDHCICIMYVLCKINTYYTCIYTYIYVYSESSKRCKLFQPMQATNEKEQNCLPLKGFRYKQKCIYCILTLDWTHTSLVLFYA